MDLSDNESLLPSKLSICSYPGIQCYTKMGKSNFPNSISKLCYHSVYRSQTNYLIILWSHEIIIGSKMPAHTNKTKAHLLVTSLINHHSSEQTKKFIIDSNITFSSKLNHRTLSQSRPYIHHIASFKTLNSKNVLVSKLKNTHFHHFSPW